MTVHPRGPQGQHPAVWVTEAYPPVLKAAMARRGGVPAAVHELVLEQLGHRTPAALRERVERRFFAQFSHLPSGEITERADEIAYALVAPGECPAPRCEDGWLLDQYDAAGGCPRCRQRAVQTAALPPEAPRAAPATVTAAAASIRRTILLARTAAHAQQSRADERRQRTRS